MKNIILIFLTGSCMVQLQAQGTFKIPSGTSVKVSGDAYIVLADMNLENNSTLVQTSGNGTLKFTGNTDVTLSGTGTTTLDHLVLARGAGTQLTLQKNVSIITDINFSGGLLNLGTSNINLGANGVLLNESETSRAYSTGTGYIQVTPDMNAPSAVNAGNMGAIITSSANMGSTVIRRSFLSQTNTYGNGSSILRSYVITPTNNTGLNATFRFQYLDAELNGLTETDLTFWKSDDTEHWTNMGFDTRNTTSNYVEKTGLSDFSTWTLSSSNNALPAILAAFTAQQSGNAVELKWQIRTEENVSHYEIEKSTTGSGFTNIGQLTAGNRSHYTYTDNAPYNGNNFYRLKITDHDGSVKYSSVVKLNIGSSGRLITVYPNPAVGGIITLQFTNINKGRYQVQLFSNTGQKVYTRSFDHDGGSAARVIQFPASLNKGLYTLQVIHNETTFTESLIIK